MSTELNVPPIDCDVLFFLDDIIMYRINVIFSKITSRNDA